MDDYALTIIGQSPSSTRLTRVVAICNCGTIKTYDKATLFRKTGRTVSCGCKRKAIATQTATKHGKSNSSEYKAWSSMIQRTTNLKNKDWERYGGKGITVCEDWKEFSNFYKDMGDRPEGCELDRIDNDKGYCANNCHWTTHIENCYNQNRSTKVMYLGKQLTIRDLAILGNVPIHTMKHRWHYYKNVEDCLHPPTKEKE